MKNTLDLLFRYLPLRVSRAVHSLPEAVFNSANEIRLRKYAPVTVTVGSRNVAFDENGAVCALSRALRVSAEEFNECLMRLTDGSLYTCESYIANGFIPLAEGGRAGVCGRGDAKGGFYEITSVNLRLHRFLPYVARPLVDKFGTGGVTGTLVCSPPAVGKTTFLRSASYLIASGNGIAPKRVCIADERREIAVGIEGSGLIDVISLLPKAKAIEIFTRTMSPEVVVCDEIGADEVEAIAETQNSGIPLIASAHCKRPTDLIKRGRMKKLLEQGIFPLCVLLSNEHGFSCEIHETEKLL